MWHLLFGALAMLLIVEGALPLLNPRGWRNAFERATRLTDGQLRFIGLVSVSVGALTLSIFLA